ncbi:DUF502 domain-containing protein [Pusillimonas sp.]|uniref:DUF502 domain-containing protein n=1 Tax=Pusillimonas sp. TaxID=3040095 RepID=UPI0037C5E002
MKNLSKYFIRGLIAILPVALTLYLLFIFLSWSETLAYTLLGPIIGDIYIPGMGLAVAVLFIIALGYLLSMRRVRGMVSIFELPFNNIPVIKSIYSSVKSFAEYFSPGGGSQGGQQVVLLRFPGQPIEIVGLITRKGVDDLPDGFTRGDRVAVYLPMGYMIGGYTVFVPAEWVQPIEMSVEEAMRSSLIAWMARSAPAKPDAEEAEEADPNQSETTGSNPVGPRPSGRP